MGLCPSMCRALLVLSVHTQITRNIPRRKTHCAGAGDENMRVILTNAVTGSQRIFCRPGYLGLAGFISDGGMHPC